jgi:hypothetical protein
MRAQRGFLRSFTTQRTAIAEIQGIQLFLWASSLVDIFVDYHNDGCCVGRIGWADAIARKAMNTQAAADVFFEQILNPLQYDLLENTWLYERYQCQGELG